MSGLPRDPALRSVPGSPASSTDLLLGLSHREPVARILGAHGASVESLQRRRAQLEDGLAPESADWRLRLSSRGGDDGDLSLLLAICRSADSHAYQLLERAGVECARLRRDIIVQLRAEGEARLRTGGQTTSVRSPVPRSRPTSRTSTSPRTVRRASVTPTRRGGPASEESEASAPGEPRHDTAASPSPATQASSAKSGVQPLDAGTLVPLLGREPELARLCDALGRRRFRAPLLVGPSGCGRTLLASSLSHALSRPVFRLVATAYDTESALEEDLRVVARQRGVAVLDDLDRVPSEAAPPFLAALTHAWATGSPPVLGVTSPEGHGRLSLWVPGVMDSVDVITIEPLSGPPLQDAVKQAATTVLAEHGLALATGTKLGELCRLADRFLTGPAMPARAIDLLDLSCARTVRQSQREVTRETWLDIVSERSGLPRSRIEVRGDQDVLDLEDRLASRVVGHGHAVATIARLIRRSRAGFGGQRPVLTALLLGPSGVGKTELAKALAQALFEREDALVRLDMSEYAEPHAVARIVGAPPGYVGHEQGGSLSEALLRRPHCVVLLDEIEKAHRDVHQLLLQVFDEGRLTDGRGRLIDFRHAAVIMTSNLGADRLREGPDGPQMDQDAVLAAARSAFPVELWNRIEAPLVMQPLGPAQMVKICRRLARDSSERLFKERGIRYGLTDAACEHLLVLAGRDPMLGARPLRHLLNAQVESLLADAVLRGQLRAGSQAEVDADPRGLRIRARAATAAD